MKSLVFNSINLKIQAQKFQLYLVKCIYNNRETKLLKVHKIYNE